jgi:hypothetical protein
VVVVPLEQFGIRVLDPIPRYGQLLSIEGVVGAAVTPIFAKARTNAENRVGRNGNVTGIKELVNVGTEQ